MKKIHIHSYVIGKGGIFNRLAYNYGCSTLITCQNLTSSSFLKVSCDVESETISLTVFHLSCTLNGRFVHV